jgi:hypothetical protein
MRADRLVRSIGPVLNENRSQVLRLRVRPEHPCQEVEAPRASQDCRCHCGSLLGRYVAGGIEIKCRRCKRTFIIGIEEDFVA